MGKTKNKNIDFLLNNKHYRKLNLILYFISMTIILLTYFLTILLFSKSMNIILTSVVSFIVGLYIVINRDKLVKQISEIMHEKNRKKIKTENKLGLKSTLRNITPKNTKLKLNITPKISIKEKAKTIKSKLTKKKVNNKKQGYIEIE